MSILIKEMKMPTRCEECRLSTVQSFNEAMCDVLVEYISYDEYETKRLDKCPLIELSPHGDLIDRDALIKDGWLCLHKEAIRMGGYAIHELPLKNPSIPVIIEAEESECND